MRLIFFFPCFVLFLVKCSDKESLEHNNPSENFHSKQSLVDSINCYYQCQTTSRNNKITTAVIKINNRDSLILNSSEFDSTIECNVNAALSYITDPNAQILYIHLFERFLYKISLVERKILVSFDLVGYDFSCWNKNCPVTLQQLLDKIILKGRSDVLIFDKNLSLDYDFRYSLNKIPELQQFKNTLYVEWGLPSISVHKDVIFINALIWHNGNNNELSNGPYHYSSFLVGKLTSNCN